MYPTQSPLETLSAFAIAYFAGALSVIAVAAYGAWQRSKMPN